MRTIASFLLAIAALSVGTPAQALSFVTHVSAARGNDTNPTCDVAAPCRSFAGALAKTNSGGDIIVLDPGHYGRVATSKTVSIVNDGAGEAVISVSGGTVGVTITGPGSVVNLRGITIKGTDATVGNAGIQAGLLRTKNVKISAITIRPPITPPSTIKIVVVSESAWTGCGSSRSPR